MIAKIRLALGLLVLLPFTLVVIPIQIVSMNVARPVSRVLPIYWHRTVLRVIGVRVQVHGERPRARPMLIVSNHLSWSDIMVLGSLTRLCFVAKREVKTWPGINMLAWLQRTVFIDRTHRQQTARQANTIARRMNQGDTMVLFAEGTTGDGYRIGPFKSALFGAVHAALNDTPSGSVTVQPVAIAYTKLHGLPLGRLQQPRAAWPGDVKLAPHLISFLLAGAYDVEVVFAEPETFSADANRKQIASSMHERVRTAYTDAIRMRFDA